MYVIRLAVVGDSGVGKTSLLVPFSNHQKTTIGYDFKAKEVVISNKRNDDGTVTDGLPESDHVKLQIWDTAGQERFRSMAASYYAKARGVVLTFDVCQRDSFDSLTSWIQDVRRAAPEHCVIILCANKVDNDEGKWQVRREEFATLGLTVFETSGKTGQNVQAMFIELGRIILAEHRHEIEEVRDVDPSTGAVTGGNLGKDKQQPNIVLLDTPIDDKKARRRKTSWC